jgi:hypothetical protein
MDNVEIDLCVTSQGRFKWSRNRGRSEFRACKWRHDGSMSSDYVIKAE